MADDGEDLDHPDDLLGDEPPLDDTEGDLFVLFAEALDPATELTVDEARAAWRELLS